MRTYLTTALLLLAGAATAHAQSDPASLGVGVRIRPALSASVLQVDAASLESVAVRSDRSGLAVRSANGSRWSVETPRAEKDGPTKAPARSLPSGAETVRLVTDARPGSSAPEIRLLVDWMPDESAPGGPLSATLTYLVAPL